MTQLSLGIRLGLILMSLGLSISCSSTSAMIHPKQPTEADLIVGTQGHISTWLTLDDGQKLLFLIDTGEPYTILDKSLEPRLGKCLGARKMLNESEPEAIFENQYKAPNLYLGGVLLTTGDQILTDDLRGQFPDDHIMGVLGLDCLQNYCFQLDFSKRKICFLDSDNLDAGKLGQQFHLSISRLSWPGHITIRANFVTGDEANWVIDTGCPTDGQLENKQLQKMIREKKVVQMDKTKTPSGMSIGIYRLQNGVFGTNEYSNLILIGGRHNLIGLNLLARHQVTFNFPKRTLYLLRRNDGFR